MNLTKYLFIFPDGEIFTPDPQLTREVEYRKGDTLVFENEVKKWKVREIEHVFHRVSPRLIQTNVYMVEDK